MKKESFVQYLQFILLVQIVFNVKMIFITPHSPHSAAARVVACSWLIMGGSLAGAGAGHDGTRE